MNNSLTFPTPQKGWLPLILIIGLTIVIFIVSIIALLSGWQTIFQNLFYFPIILACVYYVRRGFVFSVVLACSDFVLMAIFSNDLVVLEGALIRVLIFILVAGVITYLSVIRIRAEEALAKTEERFHSLYLHMNEGAALHELTYNDQGIPEDYIITETNPAFERQLGFSRDAVIGKTSKEAYGVPEPPYLEIYARVALTGEPYVFETYFTPLGKYFLISASCPRKGSFATIFEDISGRKEVEAALKESEERYRSLYTDSRDAIMIVSPGHGFLAANPATIRLFACRDEQDFTGHTPASLSPEYQPDGLSSTGKSQEMMRLALENGSHFFEWTHRRVDGTDFPATVLLSRVESGGKQLLQATVRDITEHKQIEEALKESEARFRTIIHSMQFGIVIIDAHTHTILEANRKSLEMIGGSNESVIGAVCHRFICPAESGRCPVTDLGQTVDSSERVLLTMRGEKIPILKSVIKMMLGGKEVLVESFIDISERKVAEEALRESEALFRSYFDMPLQGIAITSPEKGWLQVNDRLCSLLGYTRDEIVHMTWEEMTHPDDLAVDVEQFNRILAGEIDQYTLEKRFIRKDGGEIWVNLAAGCVRDYKGNVEYLVAVLDDITERKRFQDEILKAKLHWELTFDAVPDMIAIIDDHFRIVQVNKAMADRLGVTPEEAVGMKCYEVVHHTSNPPAICPHQLLLTDSQSHSADIHEDNLNGDFFLTVSPVRDPSGTILGSVHILRDVTERKRIEKQVRESEAKFREIFNSANDAIHLHEIDERGLPGKFIDVNEVACRMLQYSKEELLEKNPLDLTTDYHSRPLEQIGEEIKTRGYAIFETEHVRKDGVVVPVEVSTHIVFIQGRKMVLSIIRDLTRRKRDEAAFRLLSADHKAIIENAPAMIWYKDTKNNFIRVNPAAAQAFGMPADQIEGKNTYNLFPDYAEKYYQDDLDVINSGQPKLGIIEQMTISNGEQLWVQTDKIPIRDDQGTITGVLVFVVDVTERILLEEEMRYHEQELKQFSAALTTVNKKLTLLSSITRHDINNQLTVLIGYLELLEMKQPDASFSTYFNNITGAAERIQAMIQFTKIYEGIGVNAPVWQDTRGLIDTALKDVVLGHIQVVNDMPAGTMVFADQLIVKVFFNLMDNAVRYGGKITTIRFSIEERGSDQVIVCEDDGDGVASGEKEKIFERGFGKNTGLGLFLSREILGITGITITETGKPGKGARFEIYIPEGTWRQAANGD